MLSSIGPTGFILLVVVALLLFGPKKLPELGRAFGRTLREFKEGAKDIMSDDKDDDTRNRREVNTNDPQRIDAQASERKADDQQSADRRLPD
jgi:sec-independent protein translocase protein TatA